MSHGATILDERRPALVASIRLSDRLNGAFCPALGFLRLVLMKRGRLDDAHGQTHAQTNRRCNAARGEN